MGGNKRGGSLIPKKAGDGLGQRCPLGGIGARPQLIQQHQGAFVHPAENANNVGQMPGKGRETLLNGLLIANVGKDVIENGKPSLDSRQVQP